MKLQALVSVLFGLASSQTYYLGDDYPASFRGGIHFGQTIKYFYLNVSSTRINFTNKNYQIKAGTNTLTLNMNFGTSASSLKAPATLSGTADIVAVHQDGKEQRLAMGLQTKRHLQVAAAGGEVLKVGTTAGSYLVEYNGPQTTNMSNPSSWVVQLVQKMTAENLTHYDSFTVKTVTENKISSTLSRFTISGDWMNSKVAGKSGLAFMVGVKNATAFNNYAVTGSDFAEKNSWVVVDSNFNVVFPASVPEYNATHITMNGGGVSQYWWLMATEVSTGNKYVLSCESMKASDYGFFGWRVMSLNDNKKALPQGTFFIRAIFTSHMGRQSPFMDGNNPSITIPGKMMKVVAHSPNANTAIAFSTVKHGKALGGLSPKQNISVNVYSVFKTVYLQWFKQATNHTNSTYGNITSGWKADGPMLTRTFTPGTTMAVSLLVPEDVLMSLPTGANKARLYGWTEDCFGKHFASQFIAGNLTFPPAQPGSGGSSTLGAGAIVGIVCAVVFVCGVAAWWLCMKNNNNTGYSKLDGGH